MLAVVFIQPPQVLPAKMPAAVTPVPRLAVVVSSASRYFSLRAQAGYLKHLLHFTFISLIFRGEHRNKQPSECKLKAGEVCKTAVDKSYLSAHTCI